MASITCHCGQVKLQFTSTSPRFSNECCCNSCFARVKYLENLGGPTVPSKPLLTSKWDNKIQIISGRDKLFAYKLNAKSLFVNIASSCCHTFLIGQHSLYGANFVATSNFFPIFHDVDDGAIVPTSRWFINQWDADRLENCDKLVGIWVNEEEGTIAGEEGFEDIFKVEMEHASKETPKDAQGETFDEVLDAIGRDQIKVVPDETITTNK